MFLAEALQQKGWLCFAISYLLISGRGLRPTPVGSQTRVTGNKHSFLDGLTLNSQRIKDDLSRIQL